MESVTKYVALFISLIYVLLGLSLVSGAPVFNAIPRRYALVVGALMIGYGLFRGYGVYQRYFSNHED